MKHTPGPWEAISNVIRTVRSPNGDGGFLVSECPASVGNRLEDARLIAAAPDLLAALQEIVSTWDSGSQAFPISMARSALAKAGGAA